MQLARMTDRMWQHLLSLREGSARPVALPDDSSACGFPLYEPIARRKGPLVLAQVGQSLDGRVATPSGDAQDVSGCDGIAHLHRCRALVDAVVVGVGTVVADDPSLSVRAVQGSSPVRVVVDCNGRLPEDAKMLHDGGTPVLVMQADDIAVKSAHAEVIRLKRQANGWLSPKDIVEALAKRGLTTILVEGGAITIARFVDADVIDRLHISVAPIIIGSGPSGIRFSPIEKLSEARRPEIQVYNIGTDIVFDCNFRAEPASRTTSLQCQNVLMADMA
jgi:diaminohydroxyphosphoribosylaminopyrimidine deaminase / 5-amino-6-(5-phosphoribosylamino)uracil reductase